MDRVRFIEHKGKRIILLDTGDGNYLELFEGGQQSPKPEDAFWHLALRSDNVDAAVGRCRAAGAPVHIEPKNLENLGRPGVHVRLAFIKGPDGELIEVTQVNAIAGHAAAEESPPKICLTNQSM